MIERLKRNWNFNRLYMIMFCLSFTTIISLTLYGLMFAGRTFDNEVTRMKSSYQYMYQISGRSLENERLDASEIPTVTVGNLYVGATLPVRDDYLELCNDIWVLFYQNEPLKEVLLSGEVPTDDTEYDCPCVLAGVAHKDSIYTEEGIDYINLGTIKCRVSGILRPISEEAYDTRLILFWNTLNQEEKEKVAEQFIDETRSIYFEVYSEQEPKQTEHDALVAVVKNYATGLYEDSFYEFSGNNIYLTSYESDLDSTMIFYLYILMLILLVAFICLLFLTDVWSNMKKREWIILRVNGYLLKNILWECIEELVGYETIGLILGVLLWLLTGAIQGQGYEIKLTLQYFAFPALLIVLLLPCVLSLISVFRLRKTSPRKYLQTE